MWTRRDSRSWVTAAAAATWEGLSTATVMWKGFPAATAARWRNWECGGDEQGLERLLSLGQRMGKLQSHRELVQVMIFPRKWALDDSSFSGISAELRMILQKLNTNTPQSVRINTITCLSILYLQHWLPSGLSPQLISLNPAHTWLQSQFQQ